MRRTSLVCLSLLLAAAARAAAPPVKVDAKKLAADAWAVFEARCAKCHGATATAELDVRNHAKLLLKQDDGGFFVVPKDLDASHLWRRVGVARDMPPKTSLTDAEINAVRAWIEGGAPAWPAVAAPKRRPFVGLKANLVAMRAHVLAAKQADRSHLRFFTLTHLHNNPKIDEARLRLARAALSKAVNSLSWKKVVLPRAIDAQQTVFAVDLRDLDWHRGRLWQAVLATYPYGLRHDEADDAELAKLDATLFKEARGQLPYVRADWFVAAALAAPLYYELLRLPGDVSALERSLGVDAAKNFLNDALTRSGFVKSNATVRNRLVERHETKAGVYWKTFDFAGGKRNNVLHFPLGPRFDGNPFDAVAFEQDQSEALFTLPNGMQGYFVADGKGKRVDREPVALAHDEKLKGSGTTQIVAGTSCIVCHKDGVIEISDDVAASASVGGGDALRKVQKLHVEQKEMLGLLAKDRRRFHAALRDVVGPLMSDAERKRDPRTWPEPVYEVLRDYREELTLDAAAYELGYENAADLKAVLKANDELKRLGLRNLLRDGGTLSRDEWERVGSASVYQRAARALNVGVPWRQVR